jgi:hypothetical protein
MSFTGFVHGWGFANYHGFLDTNSTLESIDVPGAKVTVAVGINNGEQIVGFFNDGTGQTGNQGFAETNGACCTLDVPGASIT